MLYPHDFPEIYDCARRWAVRRTAPKNTTLGGVVSSAVARWSVAVATGAITEACGIDAAQRDAEERGATALPTSKIGDVASASYEARVLTALAATALRDRYGSRRLAAGADVEGEVVTLRCDASCDGASIIVDTSPRERNQYLRALFAPSNEVHVLRVVGGRRSGSTVDVIQIRPDDTARALSYGARVAEIAGEGRICDIPANPSSMLCSAKYCPAYGTPACRATEHRCNTEVLDANRN